MEQEWIESQEREAYAHRVGQVKKVLECFGVNPGGHLEYIRQRPPLRCWIRSTEDEAHSRDSTDDCGDKPNTGRKAVLGDEIAGRQWISKSSYHTVSGKCMRLETVMVVPTAAPAEVIPTAMYLCCGNHSTRMSASKYDIELTVSSPE